eukprot:gene2596-5510_t
MFRHATTKELYCLLMEMDPTFTTSDMKTAGIKEEAEAGRYLSHQLQVSFEHKASYEALRFLREDDVTAKELELMYTNTIDSKYTQKLPELAQSFGEGVVNVFFRDIVHLLHGPRSSILDGVQGIRVILAGIILHSLYIHAEPQHKGVQLLVLRVLQQLSDTAIWWRALERYGPAPPRLARTRPNSRHQRSRARTIAVRREEASIHEENSINNRVQSFGPRVCNSNAYDLPVFYHGIEHEYGAASRRKVSSTDMLSISLNASTFNSIIAPQTEDGTIRTGVFHTLQGSIALVYSQYVENAVNTKENSMSWLFDKGPSDYNCRRNSCSF